MIGTKAQPSPALHTVGCAPLQALAANLWLLVLRGVAAIAFGILAFVWPGLTLLILIFLWGGYAIADGLIAMWAAIAGGGLVPRWWLAIDGTAGILAGVVTLVWPGMTALLLLILIAIWAIITGVLQGWGALRLRKEIEGEWLLVLSGLVSVAFGIALMVQPDAGALALIWLIGSYAILAGWIYIALAFQLKKHKRSA